MLRWPDYFADPPSDTTSGDVNDPTSQFFGSLPDQYRLIPSSTCAISVGASRPAAWAPHALLELLASPSDSTLSSGIFLCIFNPADELVTSERRDVAPGLEGCNIGDQLETEVSWKLVNDTARKR
jgi:hypothetical protein